MLLRMVGPHGFVKTEFGREAKAWTCLLKMTIDMLATDYRTPGQPYYPLRYCNREWTALKMDTDH